MAATKERRRPAELNNRKARHSYDILETFEAGIALRGSEVKSLRAGGGSIAESFALVINGQMIVRGMTIPPYENASAWLEPTARDRKLLLHRREIDRLAGSVAQKGMALIPLKVYFNEKGLAKMLLGLAKGKTNYDKRQDIKEREVKRELQREYKIR